MRKLKVIPDIIDKDLDEAKKILDKNKITYNEKTKFFPSLKILPGNVVRTKPKVGEEIDGNQSVQIYVSMKNTPLLAIFSLLILAVIIVAIGVLSFSKPVIGTSTNVIITSRNEWVKKAVVFVKKDPKMRKNISYYEYCVNSKKSTYDCDWKATNTKSITVSESGVWYVTFRSVDVDENRSSNSNTEKVYIDNNNPTIENIKAIVTNSKIELSMDIEDKLSGLYKKYYKVNDTDYVEFDGDIKLENLQSDSKYVISIKAEDMAGNTYIIELPIMTRKAQTIIEEIEDDETLIPIPGEDNTPNDDNTDPTNPTNPDNPNGPDDDEEEPGQLLIPTIDLDSLPSEIYVGDEYILPSHYDFKTETGSVWCLLDDTTEISNTSQIKDAGDYKISCTVKNALGITASIEKTITTTVKNSDEVVKDGYLWLNLYYPENSTEWQWKLMDDSVDTEGWKYYTGPILVKLTDVDKVAIRYQLNGETITDLNSNDKFISIDPNRYVLIDDESSKVKLTYTENPVKVQYRINGSKWKEYDNEFYVDSAALIEAKATYDEPLYDENGNLIINRKKVVTAQTYIKENRGSVDYSSLFGKMNIEIVSTKTELQPAESAYITINYDIDATVRQYKIDNGSWIDYTGPFTVYEPCVIYARANGMRTIVVSDEKELSRNLSNTVSYKIYGDKVKEVLIDNIPTKIAHDGQIIDLNKVKITPDKYSVAEDKFALITVTTLTDANKVEYKINDEEWEEYTEPFYVRPLTTVKARAYFPLDKEDEEETYINLDTNTLEVYINSNKDKLFGNDKALITLTTNEKADKIEYSINNGAYKEYTEPFEVEHNQKIKAKATKTYENNVKRESYSYLTLPTYYVGLSVKANPKSVLTGLTSTVTVDTYGFDFTSVEYSLDNVTYIPYTKSFEVLAGSTVYVRGLYHGEYINTTAHIDEIIPVEPLRGPEIIADPNTDTLEPVEITINTLESAYKKYYRINGGNWRSYETTFEVDKNCTIDAYYERLEDGKISEISTYYVDNIQIPNMPLVKIDVNPSDYNKKNYDQATITVISTYADRVEYSFDNVLYQEYTGPFTIDKTVTIYAKGINEYGETVTNKVVYLKKPASVPVSIETKQLTLDIMSNPDNTITGLVNKTEVSIIYDKLATQKLYKIGYYGTWQEYKGPFEVTNNTTIYAYASNDETSISKSYQVNFLTTGISDPVISLNTTKATYDANVTIKYAKTASIMKYKIGQYGDWQDYVEPFTVSENTTIYAYNEDVLGNKGTTSYTINNIIKRPKYTEIETDGYYLLKLNYPDIAIDKEYKWGQNGTWKPYNDKGVLLIKEKYKDDLISSDGVLIVTDEGIVAFKDDYYIVDFDDPEAIAYNLFLRWDTYHPDGPRIVLETTEPVQETKAAIVYDSTIKAKYYKLVHNGVDTGWLEYTGPIDIKENYTTIYAYGVTNNGIDSKVSQYTVTNIDKDKPKITYSGDLINPRRYVGITIKATDNKGIEEVKWDEGNKDIKYFEDDGITVKNGSSIRIDENGTYTLYAIDKAGNSTVETFTVSNIDKDAPNIFIKVLTEELSGTVKVEVDYGDSTTKRYSFNNTTWMTYNEDNKITIKARDVLQYLNTDKTLTVYARGTDKAGNPTTVSEIIYNLDTDIPGVPVITTEDDVYPTITELGVVVGGVVSIEYDMSREDTINYYSVDNGKNWYVYEGPFLNESTGTVRAKTETSTGLVTETSKATKLASDALGTGAYDNNYSTRATGYIYVDKSMQGKYIYYRPYYSSGYYTMAMTEYDKDGNELYTESFKTEKKIYVDPNTTKLYLTGNPAEIRVYNEPSISNKFHYAKITEYGMEEAYETITIQYFSSSIVKQYKIGNGEWKAYTEPIKLTDKTNEKTIYARGIDKNGNITPEVSYTFKYASDALTKSSFDGSGGSRSSGYFEVSPEMQGNRLYYQTYFYSGSWVNVSGTMSQYDKDGNLLQANTTKSSTVVSINKNTTRIYAELATNIRQYNEPTLTAEYHYPTLTEYGMEEAYQIVSVNYFQTSVQKQYKIGDGDWQEYTGPVKIIDKANKNVVYARGLDKNGVVTGQTSYSFTYNSDSLNSGGYDGRGSSRSSGYFEVSTEMLGKRLYYQTYYYNGSSWVNVSGTMRQYDKDGNLLQTNATSSSTVVSINRNTAKIYAEVATNIRHYNEAILTAEYHYPTLTEYGMEEAYQMVKINYFQTSVQKQYKIGDGEWTDYTGPVKITAKNNENVVYARGIDKDGVATSQTSLSFTYNSDSLNSGGYDGTNASYSYGNFEVDETMRGKNIYYQLRYVNSKYVSSSVTEYDKDGNTLATYNLSSSTYRKSNPATTKIYVGTVADVRPYYEPILTAEYHYPTLTEYGMEEAYQMVKINYFQTSVQKQYKIGDGDWQDYTGPVRITAKNNDNVIYARGIDKNGKASGQTSLSFNYNNDSLNSGGYDGTNASYSYGNFEVDETMRGKNIYYQLRYVNSKYVSSSVTEYDKDGNTLATYSLSSSTYRKSNANTTKIYVGTVADVRPYYEPIITAEYHYPNLTEQGMEKPYNVMTINYFQTAVKKLYRINNGEWQDYTEPVTVGVGDTIYAKSVDKNGKESPTPSKSSAYANDSFKQEGYDSNYTTYSNGYFTVDKSLNNKYITIGMRSSSYTGSLQQYDKDNNLLGTVSFKGSNSYIINDETTKIYAYAYEVSLPNTPGINIIKKYPTLTPNGLEDASISVKIGFLSKLTDQKYQINDGDLKEYNGEFSVKVGDVIKAQAYAGETLVTSTATVTAISDIISSNAFDKDYTTNVVISKHNSNTASNKVAIVPELRGRMIRVYSDATANAYIQKCDKSRTSCTNYDLKGPVTKFIIPDDTFYIGIYNAGNDPFNIYEIDVRPDFVSSDEINPIISLNDTGYTISKTVEIVYRDGYRNEYSLDSGETWIEYSEPFSVDKNLTIFARSIDENDKVVGYSTFKVTKLVYTTLPDSITEGDNYLLTEYIVNAPKGNLVCKVGEDVITNTQNLTEGDYTINCDLTIDNKVLNITKELHVEAKPNEEIGIRGLSRRILNNNPNIKTNPTLSSTAEDAGENGLYSTDVTNGFGGTDGTTYFFRGNVNNNYVRFAGKTWRIVRINEDGTIRLVLNDAMNSTQYAYNNSNDNYKYLYYSNSNAKTQLDTWYQNNISSYSDMVASGKYFCEAARTKISDSYTANSASLQLYSSYTPDLKCVTDGNGYGLVNSNIGLLNYDEIAMAGATKNNSNFYLDDSNISYWWTMSPNGMNSSSSGGNGFGGAVIWYVRPSGSLAADWNVNSVLPEYNAFLLRPVINLKPNVTFTGTGTSSDPYSVTGIDNSLDNGTTWTYCGKDYDTCTLDNGTYNVKYGKDDT